MLLFVAEGVFNLLQADIIEIVQILEKVIICGQVKCGIKVHMIKWKSLMDREAQCGGGTLTL